MVHFPDRPLGGRLPAGRQERPVNRDANGPSPEVLLRKLADDPVRGLRRVGLGNARIDEPRGNEAALRPGAVTVERDVEDAADAESAREGEVVPGREVAEAVGDQAAPVPLHAPEDVRAMADHEICARIDHRVREGDDVSAVLPEEDLATW